MGIGRSEGVARFEGFELDLRSAELRKPNGTTIRLSEQPLRILIALLERPSELVLRDDLRKRLWPNDTIVEFEHSISAAMNRLRQALGDSAESPKFIETLARRGYRWKTPVTWVQPQIAPVPPKPADGNLVGKKVSHYRVLQVVGGGGMGVVYKAEDIKLGRPVALKFLPEELAGDPAAMQRFEREARAASALNHPNICTIHAVEEHQGQPFIVMELLEGRTLREMIADCANSNSTLPMPTLLDIAIQIAQGLESAHEKGIIHRDIKPANIFITNRAQSKILDFGLAKLHNLEVQETQSRISFEAGQQEEWNPVLTLTRTGVTVGTAAYMSPEQVRGEKLDARTDLFSFGLVIYEMTTGKRAFSADSAPILHDAILSQTPTAVRQVNPHVPAQLEEIISKAIEKDPNARYQNAKQMCEELQRVNSQIVPKHLSRAWATGLGVAGTVVVGILLLFLNRPPRTISVAPEIRLTQLTTNSSENPVIGGVISPNGKYLAYSDTTGMHLKLIDTGDTRTVLQPTELRDKRIKWGVVAWFPDNTRFLANAYPSIEEWDEWSSGSSSIWTASVLGGPPTKLRDHARACAVSPDGTKISFATNKGKYAEREVWFMGPGGEQAQRFYEATEDTGIDCWSWSRDGKYYGYVLADKSGDRILSQAIEGGSPVELFGPSETKKMNDIVWLHDGRVVYDLPESESSTPTTTKIPSPHGEDYNVCNYWIMRLDPRTGKRTQEPQRLTNWPNLCVTSGTVTDDDKKLSFAGWSGFFTTYLAALDAKGTRPHDVRHFTLNDSNDYVLDWTHDSKTVFIAQYRGDNWGLYKQSWNSETPEQIISPGRRGWLSFGVTSPNAKWVIGGVWKRSGDGSSPTHMSLIRIPLYGGVPETILETPGPAQVSCARPPSTACVIAEESNDDKQLVVSSFDQMKGRGPELARFDYHEGGDLSEQKQNLIVAIDPEGSRLAIARSPEGSVEILSVRGKIIYKVPSPQLGSIIALSWAADRSGFFVTRKAEGGTELLHVDRRGRVVSMRRCLGQACSGVPSPDGRHLAIIERKQTVNMWMMENF